MTYLTFEPASEKQFNIYNEKREWLGSLEYIRVGAWMSWCLTNFVSRDIYFSASCLDEVRNKIRELNSKKKSSDSLMESEQK